MKMSFNGRMFLAAREGIVTSRYLDSAKPPVWTIGIGHTAAAGAPDPRTFTGKLTPAQAIDLFAADLAKYEAEVTRALKRPVTQAQFDALVSFHYNTGAIGRASAVDLLNRGAPPEAVADALMLWNKPASIIPRRKMEHDLFLYGNYGDLRVKAYPATSDGKVMWSMGRLVPASEFASQPSPVVVDAVQPRPSVPATTAKPSFWQRVRGLFS